MYVTLSGKDRATLLASRPRRVLRGEHSWSGQCRVLHWAVCSECNLVYLKNDATRKSKCWVWQDQ